MSIWSTQLWLNVPSRDDHTGEVTGRSADEIGESELVGYEAGVDVATARGIGPLIRLSIVNAATESEALLTVEEARRVADALRLAAGDGP